MTKVAEAMLENCDRYQREACDYKNYRKHSMLVQALLDVTKAYKSKE